MGVIDLAKHLKSRLTIITPVFMPNEEYFTRCAESMLNQSDQNYRWVIVIDGKKSQNLLESFPIWERISTNENIDIVKFVKHKGVSRCRNEGLTRATVGFVGFLDADNWFHTRVIEFTRDMINDMIIGISEPDSKEIIVYSQAMIVADSHLREHGFHQIVHRRTNEINLMELASMNKTDLGQIFHSVGSIRFDEKLNRLVDYDYLIALKFDGYTCMMADMIMSFYNDLNRDENRISIGCDFATNAKRISAKWHDRFQEHFKQAYKEQNEQRTESDK